MHWLKELFWDSGMSTRDNLALLALGVVAAFVLYVVLLLVMIVG